MSAPVKRRRFLKTAWGGIIVFGTGLVGVPLGSCGDDRSPSLGPDGVLYGPDGSVVPLDTLEEMSSQEIAAFEAQVDDAAADVLAETDVDGKPKVPPGQKVVEEIPVLGANPSPRAKAEWSFSITGEVVEELVFSWEQFSFLPHVNLVADLHCVTGWTVLDSTWRGVLVSELLSRAGLTSKSNFVVFDCEGGYTTNVDVAEAKKPNVIIADGLFGGPLPPEYGGLARGLVPDRYFYKSGKWVTGIRVLAEDEPGYWETRGYSNTADPWTEDRYS